MLAQTPEDTSFAGASFLAMDACIAPMDMEGSDPMHSGEHDPITLANIAEAAARNEDMLRPFVEAEREFVRLQAAGEHDNAVRVLEIVLRAEQSSVQQMTDTVLSSLFERLAVGYNTLGMKHLKEGNTDASCKFFEKAEALTDPANLHMNGETRLVLRAVTYNNMGCFYKSMSKLHTALNYLKKAQKIEERIGHKCQNPAGTHLNLCALLSQMSKHQEALQQAQCALKLLEVAPPSDVNSGESLVCVAYFNMGAEYEHMRKPTEAMWAYQRALDSCTEGGGIGEDHPLAKQITASLNQLKAKAKREKGR